MKVRAGSEGRADEKEEEEGEEEGDTNVAWLSEVDPLRGGTCSAGNQVKQSSTTLALEVTCDCSYLPPVCNL